MKKTLLSLLSFLLLVSCSFDAEMSQDPLSSSETLLSNYKKGDFEAIYKDASTDMKSFVAKDMFLDVFNTQQKIHGKVKDIELQSEETGKYRTSVTNIYNFSLTNKDDQVYDMTAEFLRGHLLKLHINTKEWNEEPKFAKKLVTPVATLVKDNNYEKIYTLLGEKYPLDQVKSMIERVSSECAGIANQYESSWLDNDNQNRMIVGFVYGYEGKGYLEYRFFIENEEYPLAGIFFIPDTTVKLP